MAEDAAAREGDAAVQSGAAAREGSGGPAALTTADVLWMECGAAPPAAIARAALSRGRGALSRGGPVPLGLTVALNREIRI